jgi:hypothetical protein
VIADIPLPLFGCLLKDASGAVFLQIGPDRFLPLFTSLENLVLYKDRIGIDCLPCVLHTPKAILSFVECPPSRSKTPDTNYRIAIDPISPEAGTEFFVFTRDEFIQSLRKH